MYSFVPRFFLFLYIIQVSTCQRIEDDYQDTKESNFMEFKGSIPQERVLILPAEGITAAESYHPFYINKESSTPAERQMQRVQDTIHEDDNALWSLMKGKSLPSEYPWYKPKLSWKILPLHTPAIVQRSKTPYMKNELLSKQALPTKDYNIQGEELISAGDDTEVSNKFPMYEGSNMSPFDAHIIALKRFNYEIDRFIENIYMFMMSLTAEYYEHRNINTKSTLGVSILNNFSVLVSDARHLYEDFKFVLWNSISDLQYIIRNPHLILMSFMKGITPRFLVIICEIVRQILETIGISESDWMH